MYCLPYVCATEDPISTQIPRREYYVVSLMTGEPLDRYLQNFTLEILDRPLRLFYDI